MRMPAEWEPHERTLIAWPTATRQNALWHDELGLARTAHATLAAAVARFEPVTMVANAEDVDHAARACGDDVEVVAAEIDDSWLRDSGPILVRTDDGQRVGVDFGFNAWGEAFTPYDADQRITAALLEHFGIERVDAVDIVLEGGSVAVDGSGRLVTTERCLLNPNRNPSLGRGELEAVLARYFGALDIVWLVDGIAEDDGTDGHVDNVVAFTAPGRVMLQGCDDPDNPNTAIAAESRRRLDAAELEVVEVSSLPYATVAGASNPVPYVNFYVCNGAVLVPTVDGGEARWLDLIGEQFGDREVVAIPGEVLAYGGGGVHCITQQVIPA
jgi:agmatine deiminase